MASAVFAAINASAYNQSNILNRLFAPTVLFIGTNTCNGNFCPANPASPYNVGGTLVVGDNASGSMSITDGSVVSNMFATVGLFNRGKSDCRWCWFTIE